ncbi:50S ribosomal protein L29 [Synechococcus sp. CS-1325]|uniref:50S ribosomal protein L29 n=1 Tax=unclassified Synechococcus TaxID=2626047 RepID=UPI000DB7FC15|nr:MULTISPECIES: 50S ribosomal protein L29 [unclassified Synechococcus]PZV01391.1 MAG: 50S ribosomal protein L29 [Cyanobium sp.]MCT0198573.1 50S ribosomal protein L29 [Synechococcus sp. CS-1325]MCT0213775.1 50S ribosomal protein L29 [Synechococcus sp. CS-1326]MCT0229301.1 50S ribosomal protein L29 [Synechococcus sp. CS-1324]MCT0233805.1 50S ribosomal protein L29 [Synechococcus sp. CS-1327]
MARPDITEVRNLTDAEIQEQISGCRRELFDLRFQQATRRLEQPHRFKQSRIKLAHLLTVQKERQRSALSAS